MGGPTPPTPTESSPLLRSWWAVVGVGGASSAALVMAPARPPAILYICTLDAHTDVLEALGKHLPAHGRVAQVCVCPPAGHQLHTSAEAMMALIEIACRRLPPPTTAHPVLALPTTHPRAALASLVTPGPAYGGW